MSAKSSWIIKQANAYPDTAEALHTTTGKYVDCSVPAAYSGIKSFTAVKLRTRIGSHVFATRKNIATWGQQFRKGAKIDEWLGYIIFHGFKGKPDTGFLIEDPTKWTKRRSPNNCPACSAKFESMCKCMCRMRICPAGHKWHVHHREDTGKDVACVHPDCDNHKKGYTQFSD